MSKLLLVDGSALLHRAYHAYPPLRTKSGEIVGAVYGVASILIVALESEAPTHVMVAWDLPKPTFRHIKYVGYKAQRPKADEEMITQIPWVKDLVASMGVVQVEQEGYEADDIIGTLSRIKPLRIKPLNQNTIKPLEVVILTGDQDTMQLVSKHVRVLTPAKGESPPTLYGPDEVFNKYGVHPEQIVDYKAIVGDASDNIPGVAGIGPMTAAKLLQKYGTLREIYAALNSKSEILNLPAQAGSKQILNLKIVEKLVNGKESAFLSQDLSRIVTDMGLTVTLPDMEYKGLRGDSLQVKLEELGFKSLVRRIFPGAQEKKSKNENQMGLF